MSFGIVGIVGSKWQAPESSTRRLAQRVGEQNAELFCCRLVSSFILDHQQSQHLHKHEHQANMAGRILPVALATVSGIAIGMATFGEELKAQRMKRLTEEYERYVVVCVI